MMLVGCDQKGIGDAYTLYVDEEGMISLPKEFRSWSHIGSWVVVGENDEESHVDFLHNVYTQPRTIAAFKTFGSFPDGSVLVKEVWNTDVGAMTTGQVGWGSNVSIWFVMIKDTQGRFPESGLWGDGWGWAMFNGGDPNTVVIEDYKEACIPCHMPAQDNDWVYLDGYPDLKS